MRHRATPLLLAMIGAACGAPAHAAEPGQWQYRIAPYIWGAGVDGTLAHARVPVTLHPSASFGDIWENLDFAAMMAFEAQRDRHGLVGEVITLRLSSTVNVPIPTTGVSVPVDLGGDTTSVLLAYQYRWFAQSHGHLDVVAGVRYWSTGTEFAYALPAPPPPPVPQAYDGSQSRDWVDLQLGIKGRREFDNRTYVGGWMLGGAGGSDLSMDVMLLGGYRFNDRVALSAGYRWLKADYSTSNGFVFDVTMHGPGLGLEFAF